jgi:Sec-independent protein translocase protein TatA
LFLAAIVLIGMSGVPAGAINLGKILGAGKSAEKDQKSDTQTIGESEIKLPPWTGPKKRLGVMDMEVKIMATTTMEPTPTGGATSTTAISIAPPTDFGTGLAEMLTTSLIDSGRFIVLERKALADIQAEQQLAASGAVDPTSAAGAGKLLGAQALIRGAVTNTRIRDRAPAAARASSKGSDLRQRKPKRQSVWIYASTMSLPVWSWIP